MRKTLRRKGTMAEINRALADAFVKKIRKQLPYSVNVFNEKAVIIASTDEQRIGSFHFTVNEMIQQSIAEKHIYHTTEAMIGVKNGINLLITDHQEPIGAVGITGNPDQLMEIAKLIKMTFETMLEYETMKQRMAREKNLGGAFVYALLFERPYREQEVRRMARERGLRESAARVPFMVRVAFTDDFAKKLPQKYLALPCAEVQDIAFLMDSHTFFVFKAVPEEALGLYRRQLCDCCEQLAALLRPHLTAECGLEFLCGTPQLSYESYSAALGCVRWLSHHKKRAAGSMYFFADYLTDYFLQLASKKAADTALRAYCQTAAQKVGLELFIETAQCLLKNNMHLGNTAKQLYLHKNTVAFRLAKIKEALDIDPMEKAADRSLLQMIVSYLTCYGKDNSLN